MNMRIKQMMGKAVVCTTLAAMAAIGAGQVASASNLMGAPPSGGGGGAAPPITAPVTTTTTVPVTTTTTTVPVTTTLQLPATGSDSGPTAWVTLIVLASGASLVVVARRRVVS